MRLRPSSTPSRAGTPVRVLVRAGVTLAAARAAAPAAPTPTPVRTRAPARATAPLTLPTATPLATVGPITTLHGSTVVLPVAAVATTSVLPLLPFPAGLLTVGRVAVLRKDPPFDGRGFKRTNTSA